MEKIKVVILNFEQIGQEECKTMTYVEYFTEDTRVSEINKWIKTIDKNKDISHAYITTK